MKFELRVLSDAVNSFFMDGPPKSLALDVVTVTGVRSQTWEVRGVPDSDMFDGHTAIFQFQGVTYEVPIMRWCKYVQSMMDGPCDPFGYTKRGVTELECAPV